jgi:hypothetical protein
MGSKVETMRFQAMGQLSSTCTAPPCRGCPPRCASGGPAEAARCRSVAVQVGIRMQNLKPGDHISGARVETGCFQAQGATAFNLYSPTEEEDAVVDAGVDGLVQDVAVQVALKSRRLKPGFHFIGSALKPGGFKLSVRLDSTCTGPTRMIFSGAPHKPSAAGISQSWNS